MRSRPRTKACRRAILRSNRISRLPKSSISRWAFILEPASRALPYQGYPRFRLALGNPLLLEDLLVRHPKLRVFIAHGGEPWRRETIALMGMYQQVYMDVGTIWLLGSFNRSAIDDWFREMFSHDLGKRIMFGTDQMAWPDAVGMAIEVIESVKFLTEEQRRDILYNNAARFLRLTASDGRVGPVLPGPLLEPTAPRN